MYAGYRHRAGPANRAPVVTFAGHDDETTPPATMGTWAALSPAPLRQHAYPGGHFLMVGHPSIFSVRSAGLVATSTTCDFRTATRRKSM